MLTGIAMHAEHTDSELAQSWAKRGINSVHSN